ncbi:hypothetical protein KQI69_00570, partial [Eubacterium sp. MSJ-13]|uniref:hypothetical protein n=1 Tax=Eubacterium sp. MSJ-13 TaxID=2841513 RepID=UPI001C10114E
SNYGIIFVDMLSAWIFCAYFVYGFWRGWKQLSKGEGFLASRLPQKTKIWLNQKKAGPIAAKIGISFVLSYVFAGITLAIAAYTFIKIICRIFCGIK